MDADHSSRRHDRPNQLFPHDLDFLRGFDAKPNSISLDFQNRHRNVLANDNAFAWLSSENEYLQSSLT